MVNKGEEGPHVSEQVAYALDGLGRDECAVPLHVVLGQLGPSPFKKAL